MAKEKYSFRSATERSIIAFRKKLIIPGMIVVGTGGVLIIIGLIYRNYIIANVGSLFVGLGGMATWIGMHILEMLKR